MHVQIRTEAERRLRPPWRIIPNCQWAKGPNSDWSRKAIKTELDGLVISTPGDISPNSDWSRKAIKTDVALRSFDILSLSSPNSDWSRKAIKTIFFQWHIDFTNFTVQIRTEAERRLRPIDFLYQIFNFWNKGPNSDWSRKAIKTFSYLKSIECVIFVCPNSDWSRKAIKTCNPRSIFFLNMS